jgi:hypothetical protein
MGGDFADRTVASSAGKSVKLGRSLGLGASQALPCLAENRPGGYEVPVMLFFLGILKWLLALALFGLSAWALIAYSNPIVSSLSYKGLEVKGLPATVIFGLAGVAVLRFWPIKRTVTETVEYHDGDKSKATTATTLTTNLKGP